MKPFLLLCLVATLLLLHPSQARCQKMYIWCPSDITKTILPRLSSLQNQKVSVRITDARTFGTKVSNKCSSEEIGNSIYTVLKAAFPNAIFSQSMDTIPAANTVTIALTIVAYHASFSTAVWHAYTTYAVTIRDGRTDQPKETSKTVEESKSFFNALGVITAKSNLKKCYTDACIQLVDFIAETIKPIQ